MLKKRVDDLINKNTDLSKGIRITTNTAIVIEFTARLVSCIVWTLNIDNSSGVILAVWMPQIHLLTVIVVQNSFTNIYICLQENKDKEKSKMSCKDRYANSELRIFSNMCASAFALFYALNPAIILTFAYPAQTIVIYTSVTAYLFATSIFSASIIKLNRGLTKDNQLSDKKDQKSIPECNQDINKGDKQPVQWTKISVKILIFIILWLIVVYLHFLLVLTSYLLLIGKSSVINSTPSFIISLVPSILISGGAWFAKKVAFETEVENE